MNQIMEILPFASMLLAFVLGFIFPIGKIARKTALIIYGGYFLLYIIIVSSGFFSIYNRPQDIPTKFDYSDPQTVLWVSAIGAFVLLFPGVILYIIGSFIKYTYLFIRRFI